MIDVVFILPSQREIDRHLESVPHRGDFVKIDGKEYLVGAVVWDLNSVEVEVKVYLGN